MKKMELYDQRYSAPEYYFGKKPSKLCSKVLEFIQATPDHHPTLIDLCAGEGRNVIYFAKKGFKTTAMDISLPGLAKAKKFAKEEGVQIETIHADIVNYQLERTYDVVFSTGSLQYIPVELRRERIQNYKDNTSADGINAISVIVEKPFIPRAHDTGPYESGFKSGELMNYYWDWEILVCMEGIFDDNSGGIPHQHAINWMVARKR